MAQTSAVKTPLRRSFSEHVKDSTNKAWDVFWKSVRERRLWGGSGRRKLTIIPPEAEGYSVKALKAVSVGGKAIFYIVPLQETLDISPLPPDSQHFSKMPKKICYQCNEVMPLQMLAVHIKTCKGKNYSDGTDDECSELQIVENKCKVVCPICTKEFPEDEIIVHADLCGESFENAGPAVNENSPCQFDETLASPTKSMEDVLHFLEQQVDATKEFKLCVDRESLPDRGILQWQRKKNVSPASALKVVFIGEAGIDTGALKKEFLTDMISGIERRFFEGRESQGKNPKYSLSDLDNEIFRTIGEIISVSLAQGGPAPAFFKEWGYNFLCSGEMDFSSLSTEDVADQESSILINKVENAEDTESLLQWADEIISCGYTSKITQDKKESIIRAIVLHSTTRLIPMLQQLRNGMELYGLLNLMSTNREACHGLFVPGKIIKPDADFMMMNCQPQFSEKGTSKERTERKIINFLQDYMHELEMTEIEAKEACDWLRAAGFPQYVQLFKDCRFPVDIEWVKRDHHFLDKDATDSLCRRLITLNKCMEMRLELRRSKRRRDDCDEEDFCAISPNWTYDRRTRQWRRLNSTVETLSLSDSPAGSQDAPSCDAGHDHHDVCSIHSSSSSESEGRHGDKAHREPDTSSAAVTTSTTDDQETSRSSSRCSSTNKTPSLDTSFSGPPSPVGGSSTVSLEAESFPDKPPRKKCSTLLRKMEKLRLRGTAGLLPVDHSGGRNSAGLKQRVISGPVLVEDGERMHCPSSLQARPNSRSSSTPSSPHTISSSSSNSHSENSSTVSTPSPVIRVRSNCKRSNSGAGPAGAATRNNQNHSETEDYRNQVNNNNNSSHESLVFQIPQGHKPGTFPTSLAHKHTILSPIIDNTSVNWRTGSFHGYRGRQSCRRGTSSLAGGDRGPTSSSSSCGVSNSDRLAGLDHRLSVYDNVPDDVQLSESGSGSDVERMGEESEVSRLLAGEDVFSALDSVLERISDLQQLVTTWSENISEDDCQRGCSTSSSSSQDSAATSPCPSSPSHIHLEVQHPESCEKVPEEPETRSPQARSRVSQQLHWSSEQSLPSLPSSPGVESQSASQILLLQKLSLLKLTALMDRYSPSSKQGWNWTVPKPPRKTNAMEVKGQRVFGVPLLLNLQQTGETLPPSILRALVYLRAECLDQVGLFRKSGVKSRIQYLRELVESDPDGVSYDGQSAFDVADMVKQYFRDLPEPVFTSKLCESFLHIYQYFPKDQQLVAAQAAVLLLPDENREALRTLLFFLRDVVACVDENQMTPTNIAVCLAPSLFHLNTIKRDANAARSSHRKYSLGRPDQRDLSENLAATQGLANMITEAPRLFQLPEFWPGQSVGEESREAGGGDGEQEEGRRRLQLGTQQLLKEAREKSPGWELQPAPENVELASKKLNDGCPLWMWRGSVEVDAPQQELLQRLLREQQMWDRSLRQAAVIQTLSKDAEVYRCLLQGHNLGPRPLQEHLLLRTWQADPSSGPLFLSSASTEHPEVQAEGIRAHVHACLYLLEPTGAIKTRLTHLCRTDSRGRSHEWHSKVGGYLLASGLLAVRDSFRADYKETKI